MAGRKANAQQRARRVLLDSNIWRYIVDANALIHLRRIARAPTRRIVVAPSLAYEALRSHDEGLRTRLAAALSDETWGRLLPDAYSESREFVDEVRRLRPWWLRQKPDRAAYDRLLVDWTRLRGGFWERLRTEPSEYAAWAAGWETPLLEEARAQHEERHESMRDARVTFERLELRHAIVTRFDKRSPEGWRGDPIAAWRLAALNGFGVALYNGGSLEPFREWVQPFVDLDRIQRTRDVVSWHTFWLYDADEARMPRFWLRWALATAMGTLRASPGEAVDVQHGTYLLEADCFVTADKALVRAIEKVREVAPTPVARAVRAPAGEQAAPWLLEFLRAS